tara:strand:+ start:808 stop:1215 length:408 start_codon:yes stop_codon:yes gene_type:complete
MASELRVNTLKDAAGNNSVGMSYVANGSSKAWVNFNGTGTPTARDSFNLASITDNATGDQTVNFSNSLSSGNYMWSGSTGDGAGVNQSNWLSTPSGQNPTAMMQAGSVRVKNSYANALTNSDLQYIGVQVTGDLA